MTFATWPPTPAVRSAISLWHPRGTMLIWISFSSFGSSLAPWSLFGHFTSTKEEKNGIGWMPLPVWTFPACRQIWYPVYRSDALTVTIRLHVSARDCVSVILQKIKTQTLIECWSLEELKECTFTNSCLQYSLIYYLYIYYIYVLSTRVHVNTPWYLYQPAQQVHKCKLWDGGLGTACGCHEQLCVRFWLFGNGAKAAAAL